MNPIYQWRPGKHKQRQACKQTGQQGATTGATTRCDNKVQQQVRQQGATRTKDVDELSPQSLVTNHAWIGIINVDDQQKQPDIHRLLHLKCRVKQFAVHRKNTPFHKCFDDPVKRNIVEKLAHVKQECRSHCFGNCFVVRFRADHSNERTISEISALPIAK